MGNRALRKKLTELVGRTIYTGHKLAAYKVLTASHLRRMIADASVKVGDVIHDCTGFNHRVAKVELEWRCVDEWRRGPRCRSTDGEFLRGVEITFDGGNPRCECSAVDGPATVEHIEKWWLSWIEYQWASKQGWADSPFCHEVHRRLKAGERICDEHGIRLPELEALDRNIT